MSGSLGTKTIDSSDVVDFDIDWTALLNGSGIASAVWDVPAQVSQPAVPAVNANTTKVWVTCNVAGDYNIACKITTDDSPQAREFERSFILKVAEL